MDDDAKEAIRRMIIVCRELAGGESEDLQHRAAAIRLLGHTTDSNEEDLEVLASLLHAQTPLRLQEAAVDAMQEQNASDIPQRMLASWGSLSPKMRTRILDALGRRSDWTRELLAAIETNALPMSALDARRRQQLLHHRDTEIAKRAAALMEPSSQSNRQALIDQYGEQIAPLGDRQRGNQLFEKHCSKCHRFQGKGYSVGPDLAAVVDKSPQAMLVAVLDPNRAVEDKFLDFLAITVDGRQHSGMIVNETSNSITLSVGEGKEQALLRTEIEDFRTTGKSLMPEGLEQELKPSDLADLIAYVRSERLVPKSFAGNTPQVAPVRDDGSIRLFAIHSRIYGPSLMFEPSYRNLGSWQSLEDFAAWDLDVPADGRYRVVVDYACDDRVAGNRFQLSIAGQSLGALVQGTGSWEVYRTTSVGTVDLRKGPAELVVRSDGPLQGALMDLRTIRLHRIH